MQQRHPVRRHCVRISAATATLLAVGTGGALLDSAVADAAGSTMVLPSCSTTVQGSPGQPVALSQSAVIPTVTNVVSGIPLLGPSAAQTAANTMNSWAPIPLGTVPSSGSLNVSGSQISTLVVNEINTIPVLGPALSLVDSGVRNTLTGACNDVVNAIQPPPPPPPPSPARPSSPAQQPGGQSGSGATQGRSPAPSQVYGDGAVPGGPAPQVGVPDSGAVPGPDGPFAIGTSPAYDYSNLPGAFTAPSIDYAALPGSSTPDGGSDPAGGQQGSPNDVAGPANVLAADSTQGLDLPIAIAVLALGAVTAALVRTFVLRRAAA